MGIFQADSRKSDFAYTLTQDISKGDVLHIQDVYAFAGNDEVSGHDVTMIYKCAQARAEKKVGTGFDILKGDQLFIDMNDGFVSPTKSAGYIFVGWAKEDADASDTTVLMEFDGTLNTLL